MKDTEYAIEVNLYRHVPLYHLLNQVFFHSTLILSFFLLSALKECLFTILDGLCVSLGPYRKITNLCLDFPTSADVTLYPTSRLLEMPWRRMDNRDYLTCIICSKPGFFSFLPVLHFITSLFTFSLFLKFYFYNFSLSSTILIRHHWSHYLLFSEGQGMLWVSLHQQKVIYFFVCFFF